MGYRHPAARFVRAATLAVAVIGTILTADIASANAAPAPPKPPAPQNGTCTFAGSGPRLQCQFQTWGTPPRGNTDPKVVGSVEVSVRNTDFRTVECALTVDGRQGAKLDVAGGVWETVTVPRYAGTTQYHVTCKSLMMPASVDQWSSFVLWGK